MFHENVINFSNLRYGVRERGYSKKLTKLEHLFLNSKKNKDNDIGNTSITNKDTI